MNPWHVVQRGRSLPASPVTQLERSLCYAKYKRLAKGGFEFPKVIGAGVSVQVSATDLALILGGVALNAKRRMRYTCAASTTTAN
jgi:hypothetical protein